MGINNQFRKNIMLLVGAGLAFLQCRTKELPQATGGRLNKEFRINLNQTISLGSGNKKNLGTITFTHLDESRCPANAMCVRQGAAITTFVLRTEEAGTQNVRLFIGDFMPHDPRDRRNLTADTVVVQLKDKNRYQLILKEVAPYPGTANEAPRAIILIKRP